MENVYRELQLEIGRTQRSIFRCTNIIKDHETSEEGIIFERGRLSVLRNKLDFLKMIEEQTKELMEVA